MSSFVLITDPYSIYKQVLPMKKNNYFLEDIEKINIRLYNYPESMITLKNLKAAYIGGGLTSSSFFF